VLRTAPRPAVRFAAERGRWILFHVQETVYLIQQLYDTHCIPHMTPMDIFW